MQLKPITHGPKKNRFCGPAVISFITGLTTDDAAALIRIQTGRRAVMGTGPHEVSNALRACGFRMIGDREYGKDRPTLARWLRDNKERRTAGRVFLIIAGNHWQLVTGQRFACGIVGEIVSVRHAGVKRRARVNSVYEIVHETDADHARAATAKARDTVCGRRSSDRHYVNWNAAARRRTKALAAKHAIEIEVDDFGGGSLSIYAFPPAHLSEARERGDVVYDAVAYSWSEAEGMVGQMVGLLSNMRRAA